MIILNENLRAREYEDSIIHLGSLATTMFEDQTFNLNSLDINLFVKIVYFVSLNNYDNDNIVTFSPDVNISVNRLDILMKMKIVVLQYFLCDFINNKDININPIIYALLFSRSYISERIEEGEEYLLSIDSMITELNNSVHDPNEIINTFYLSEEFGKIFATFMYDRDYYMPMYNSSAFRKYDTFNFKSEERYLEEFQAESHNKNLLLTCIATGNIDEFNDILTGDAEYIIGSFEDLFEIFDAIIQSDLIDFFKVLLDTTLNYPGNVFEQIYDENLILLFVNMFKYKAFDSLKYLILNRHVYLSWIIEEYFNFDELAYVISNIFQLDTKIWFPCQGDGYISRAIQKLYNYGYNIQGEYEFFVDKVYSDRTFLNKNVLNILDKDYIMNSIYLFIQTYTFNEQKELTKLLFMLGPVIHEIIILLSFYIDKVDVLRSLHENKLFIFEENFLKQMLETVATYCLDPNRYGYRESYYTTESDEYIFIENVCKETQNTMLLYCLDEAVNKLGVCNNLYCTYMDILEFL